MCKIDISIIVPIYNKEKYIEKNINSLVKQNFKNFEIILIDDGSIDRTYEKIGPFLKDKRVKYIKIKNSGVSIARNKGVSLAQGKYAVFIDADDFIHENMLQVLYEKMENEKLDLVMCGMHEILSTKHKIIRALSNEKIELESHNLEKIVNIDPILFHSCGNKLFNLEIIRTNKITFLEKCHSSEDLNFVLKYLSCIRNFQMLEETYYYYLRNDQSVTRQKQEGLDIKNVFNKELQTYNAYKDIQVFLEKKRNKFLLEILNKKIKHYNLCINSIKVLQNSYIKNSNINFSELKYFILKIIKKYDRLDRLDRLDNFKLSMRGYIFKYFRQIIKVIYQLKKGGGNEKNRNTYISLSK